MCRICTLAPGVYATPNVVTYVTGPAYACINSAHKRTYEAQKVQTCFLLDERILQTFKTTFSLEHRACLGQGVIVHCNGVRKCWRCLAQSNTTTMKNEVPVILQVAWRNHWSLIVGVGLLMFRARKPTAQHMASFTKTVLLTWVWLIHVVTWKNTFWFPWNNLNVTLSQLPSLKLTVCPWK